MSLKCNAKANAAATRVWQSATETTTQNLAAASVLYRFKITDKDALTASVHLSTKGGDQLAVRRKSGSASVFQCVGNTSTGNNFAIDFTPTVANWATLLLTYTSGAQNLYLNGTLVGTGTATGSTWNPAGNDRIQIGVDDVGIDISFDEFCVWNRVLNSTERGNLLTQRAVTAAASGRVLNYDFHASPGTGNVANGDAALADVSGNGQPALNVQGGTPVWISDDPFVVPAPNISLSIRGVTVATGATFDLGTWPAGDDVAVRVNLSNIGDASLTVSSIGLTGSGTLVSTALAGSYAASAQADLVFLLSCATTGTSKSAVITINSNDADTPAYVVTFSYDVAVDADRTLSPHASATATAGTGFSNNGGSGVAIPTASATPHGSGFDAYSPAVAADIHGIDWVDGSALFLCVCTDTSDLGDIDFVQFYHEGTAKTIYTKALSPRTGAEGFLCKLTRASDGASDVYWRVVPVNGLEVVGTCRIFFNPSGTLYGATTNITSATNPAVTIAAAVGGDRIKLSAGTYTWTDSGSNFYPSKPVIVELAAGLSPGDVIITTSTRTTINVRPSKVIFRGIKIDTSKINNWVGIGNNAGNDPRAGTKFEDCLFIDPDGVTGPARGYTTIDGSLRQIFFAHDRNQPYYLERCTAVTYNGVCGATCVVNSSVTMSFDALFVAGTAATGQLYGCIDVLESGRFKQREHIEQTLTVSAKTGTGPTILTFSGAPTIADAMDISLDAVVEFLTGALAGQTFLVIGSNNTAKTITVATNASAAVAGDACWCYLYAHPNVIQMSDSTNPNGVILNRIRAIIDHTEPFRLDRDIPANKHRGVWIQSTVIALSRTAGVGNVAAWEADHENCGLRQVTLPRSFVPEIPSPADTTLFDVNACAMFDCACVSVQGSPGTLDTSQTKFRFDNNNFSSGPSRGSNCTTLASAVDSSGIPVAASPVLGRLYMPRLRYDAWGRPYKVDGTGAVGGSAASKVFFSGFMG